MEVKRQQRTPATLRTSGGMTDYLGVDMSKSTKRDPEKNAEAQRRWRESNPAVALAKARKFKADAKAATDPTATNTGNAWTDEDRAFLLRDDLSIAEMSKILGRTYSSVTQQRAKQLERKKRLAMVRDTQVTR